MDEVKLTSDNIEEKLRTSYNELSQLNRVYSILSKFTRKVIQIRDTQKLLDEACG